MEVCRDDLRCVAAGVLILIIMEDTHGVRISLYTATAIVSLNPYYNGRYSWRNVIIMGRLYFYGLNPYYNGRYSWRSSIHGKVVGDKPKVLILIIMEDTHGVD